MFCFIQLSLFHRHSVAVDKKANSLSVYTNFYSLSLTFHYESPLNGESYCFHDYLNFITFLLIFFTQVDFLRRVDCESLTVRQLPFLSFKSPQVFNRYPR